MTWEDIIKRKRKRYPTTAQKKNKNWNNLTDEEKLQVRMERSWKGQQKRRDNELERLRTCPKCGWKDNLHLATLGHGSIEQGRAKFCPKCGTKMRERE